MLGIWAPIFSVGISAKTVIHLGMQFLIPRFPKHLPDPIDSGQTKDSVHSTAIWSKLQAVQGRAERK